MSDTDCPVVGVHEHPFRGPHYFREWEPGTRPAPDATLREALEIIAAAPDASVGIDAIGITARNIARLALRAALKADYE